MPHIYTFIYSFIVDTHMHTYTMCMGFMPPVTNSMVDLVQNELLWAPMVQTVHRVLTWPCRTLCHKLGKIRHSITHLLRIISETFNIRHMNRLTYILVLYGAAVDRAESHPGSPRRVCDTKFRGSHTTLVHLLRCISCLYSQIHVAFVGQSLTFHFLWGL